MNASIWDTCLLVPGLSSSACASWVQAWGTIAAVLLSAYIARGPRRRERRDAITAAVGFAIALRTALEVSPNTLRSVYDVASFRAGLVAAQQRSAAVRPEFLSQDALQALVELQCLAVEVSACATGVGEEFRWTAIAEMIGRVLPSALQKCKDVEPVLQREMARLVR